MSTLFYRDDQAELASRMCAIDAASRIRFEMRYTWPSCAPTVHTVPVPGGAWIDVYHGAGPDAVAVARLVARYGFRAG